MHESLTSRCLPSSDPAWLWIKWAGSTFRISTYVSRLWEKQRGVFKRHLLGPCWIPELWARVALGQQHIPPPCSARAEEFKAVVRLQLPCIQGKSWKSFSHVLLKWCCFIQKSSVTTSNKMQHSEENKPLYPRCNVPELLKAGMAFEPPTGPQILPDPT